jgi:hypothetical protein
VERRLRETSAKDVGPSIWWWILTLCQLKLSDKWNVALSAKTLWLQKLHHLKVKKNILVKCVAKFFVLHFADVCTCKFYARFRRNLCNFVCGMSVRQHTWLIWADCKRKPHELHPLELETGSLLYKCSHSDQNVNINRNLFGGWFPNSKINLVYIVTAVPDSWTHSTHLPLSPSDVI